MNRKLIKNIIIVFFILLVILLLLDLTSSQINGQSLINTIPCLSKNC
ncbi:MAG: hypothetical protein RMJ17_02145 [Candidatus Aenigmarchaeota archaeon]|nr:hypothetical protein [Candidatus Aenigmarchaeota archaeon]MDW8149374.1 hypothetical protein [Candidatus Aenigmarchaeota archaeon]